MLDVYGEAHDLDEKCETCGWCKLHIHNNKITPEGICQYEPPKYHSPASAWYQPRVDVANMWCHYWVARKKAK